MRSQDVELIVPFAFFLYVSFPVCSITLIFFAIIDTRLFAIIENLIDLTGTRP